MSSSINIIDNSDNITVSVSAIENNVTVNVNNEAPTLLVKVGNEVTTFYVDDAVEAEKNRAMTVENTLSSRIISLSANLATETSAREAADQAIYDTLTNSYVPYSGAIDQLDLGGNSLIAGGATFNGHVDVNGSEPQFTISNGPNVLDLYVDGNGDKYIDAHGSVLFANANTLVALENFLAVNSVNSPVVNSDSGFLSIRTGNADAITIDDFQNVGIGTTTPTEKLSVDGNIYSTGVISCGYFTAFVYGSFPTVYTANVDSGTNGPIVFGTNNTERMRITADGNVGIGVTNPSVSLAVAGGVEASAHVRTPNVYADNKIGVGTISPNQALTVVGNISATGSLSATSVVETTPTLQKLSERVTTISASSTNAQYPTAKAVYDWHADTAHFAGTRILPTITDNGNGTVTISNDGVFSFASSALGDPPYIKKNLTGGTFSLTDGAVNYVLANTANSALVVSTSNTTVDNLTIFPVFLIARSGNNLAYVDLDHNGLGLADKIELRLARTRRIEVEPNGLLLGETATPTQRTVTITAGTVWYASTQSLLSAFNSSTNTMLQYYHNAGVWTSLSATQYNNTQYDDGTNLQTLTNNRYAVNFVYRSVGKNKNETYLVLGGGNYTLGEAQVAGPTSIPPIAATAIFVGRIIVQKSATSATQIDSAFTNPLTFSGVTNHNSLVGIQGGTTDQYYHLTSSELASVQSLSANFVPYNGALSSVNLGNKSLSAGNITIKGLTNSSGVTLYATNSALSPKLKLLDDGTFSLYRSSGTVGFNYDPTAFGDSGAISVNSVLTNLVTQSSGVLTVGGGGGSGDTVLRANGNTVMTLSTSGNVGIGTTSVAARAHIVSTTEQLRIGYDGSNYVSATVGSSGGVTFSNSGAATDVWTFNGNAVFNGTTNRMPNQVVSTRDSALTYVSHRVNSQFNYLFDSGGLVLHISNYNAGSVVDYKHVASMDFSNVTNGYQRQFWGALGWTNSWSGQQVQMNVPTEVTGILRARFLNGMHTRLMFGADNIYLGDSDVFTINGVAVDLYWDGSTHRAKLVTHDGTTYRSSSAINMGVNLYPVQTIFRIATTGNGIYDLYYKQYSGDTTLVFPDWGTSVASLSGPTVMPYYCNNVSTMNVTNNTLSATDAQCQLMWQDCRLRRL